MAGNPGGRPRSPSLDLWRQMFGEDWSERTIARFDAAMRKLDSAREISGRDESSEAIVLATRPNGTVNVSKLLRVADARLIAAIVEAET